MDGLRLDWMKVEPQIAAYRKMVRELAFDVCELAPTTYLCARAFGKAFTAIPVFLTRDFHHHSVVCNVASRIHEPKDLVGKTFGVRAYTVTTGLWTRGVLQSEYDVDPARVTWVTDDEEHVTEWVPPPNVTKLPPGESLAAMIAAGRLDAALSGMAGIGRSGPPTANWEAAATQAIAAAGPATADDRHIGDMQEMIGGGDPLPFGLAANRATIEALIRYAYVQKVIPATVRPEDVFVSTAPDP